ncbi:MAG: DUF2066 domain-containing protein [Povalibacter sp.]
MALLKSLLLTWVVIAPAGAVTVPDLYEVSTPVATTRDAAFVDAIRAVAVKVSGRRDAGARLGATLNDPRRFVQRFAFTEDNILQVAFDSVSIDRLLTEGDLPIWSRERPSTLVLLNVTATNGSTYWVDTAGNSIERDTIIRAAKQRGLPLIWPDMSSQARAQINGDPADPSVAKELATRYNANAVLVGNARPDGAGGLNVRWTLISDAENADAAGSLEDGVHLAADAFARVYAASGSALDSVALEVSGIENLASYAGALNYLEAMTLVRGVAVEQVVGDTMKFRLAVRGDVNTLKRALALDGKLVPAAATDGMQPADRLQFRYQP